MVMQEQCHEAPTNKPATCDLWTASLQRFAFDSEQLRQIGGWAGVEQIGRAQKLCGQGVSSFFQLQSLLEPNEVQEILACAVRSDYMTHDDAVDDMPAFEYYPFCDGEWLDLDMREALHGIIEDRVLPYIRDRYRCPSCSLAAVLVRRYLPGERRTHAVHFDSQAFVTAVIGLSDPEDYEGGLFLQPGPSAHSRFFPRIGQGDLLTHSFDIQHGVHLSRGTRYSLILWMKDSPESVCDRTTPWLDRLAEQGDPHALHLLAETYESGEAGRRRDLRRAFQFYRQSAKAGHCWSQTSLGCLYQMEDNEEGAVVPFDWETSVKWFRRAAEGGFAMAQRNLALAYLEGSDGPQAVTWMRRAAEQLDVEAAHMLGEILSFGSPDGQVCADRREARLWLERSAGAGFEPSQQLLSQLPFEEDSSAGLLHS